MDAFVQVPLHWVESPSLIILTYVIRLIDIILCKNRNILLYIFSAAQKNIESYICFCGVVFQISTRLSGLWNLHLYLQLIARALRCFAKNDSSVLISFILYNSFPIEYQRHCLTFVFFTQMDK